MTKTDITSDRVVVEGVSPTIKQRNLSTSVYFGFSDRSKFYRYLFQFIAETGDWKELFFEWLEKQENEEG